MPTEYRISVSISVLDSAKRDAIKNYLTTLLTAKVADGTIRGATLNTHTIDIPESVTVGQP